MRQAPPSVIRNPHGLLPAFCREPARTSDEAIRSHDDLVGQRAVILRHIRIIVPVAYIETADAVVWNIVIREGYMMR